MVSRCNFPWLLSNVKFSKTGKNLANTQDYAILDHEGYKIALIGIAEIEWVELVNAIKKEDIVFEEPLECAQKYLKMFKHERDDIDFVIALTHMRTPRDIKLAEQIPEIDLILGGHDHVMVNHQYNNTLLRKSGTDF